MISRALAAALAVAFVAVSSASLAQDKKAAPPKAAAPAAAQEKKLTPQQQKMKDCAVKWKDEKAKKNVSGRTAYNNFMKGCLKN